MLLLLSYSIQHSDLSLGAIVHKLACGGVAVPQHGLDQISANAYSSSAKNCRKYGFGDLAVTFVCDCISSLQLVILIVDIDRVYSISTDYALRQHSTHKKVAKVLEDSKRWAERNSTCRPSYTGVDWHSGTLNKSSTKIKVSSLPDTKASTYEQRAFHQGESAVRMP
jgi:hypothetical protein